jgi:hypothetical protein
MLHIKVWVLGKGSVNLTVTLLSFIILHLDHFMAEQQFSY